MTRHTGTCQHVIHALDSRRRESRKSTGPIKQGGNRAPGFLEMENTKATREENQAVRPCLRCAIPRRARQSQEEANHWPTQGPTQMQDAFNRAFRAFAQDHRLRRAQAA